MDTLLPYILGLGLLAIATVNGIWPMRKIIAMYEGKHELKQGSAGFIRTMAGWIWVAAWIAATWFFATILGDWATHGDLEAALDRAAVRLLVLLDLLLAMADGS